MESRPPFPPRPAAPKPGVAPAAARRPEPAATPAPARHPTPAPAGDPAERRRALARRALALPDDALLSECDETFFVGGGPGGQHRNKTASAVRLVHRPSGVTVTATERRSQLQNRGAALDRLRAALAPLARKPKVRRPTKPGRAAKERRLSEKRHRSERKASRKGYD